MDSYFFDNLFTGREWVQDVLVAVDGGRIVQFDAAARCPDEVTRLTRAAIGTVDLQVNGGGGLLLNQCETIRDINTMVIAHAQFGTAGMLPTLITDNIDVIEKTADLIALAIASGTPGVLGVHFEGPHLSVSKKGAHSADKIRDISDREWAVYERPDLGKKLVTLAPESVTTSDVERLVAAGVTVFIGHSNAEYQVAKAALDAGAVGFTHLFNAMSPLTGREAGVVGAALLADEAWCGFINDGHHVSDEAMLIALKVKPVGKMVLVTDAMSLIGTNESEFDFFDRKVLRDGNKLTSTTGELAGSHLDLISAITRAETNLDLSFDEAWRMASTYPAECLGLEGREELKLGSFASIVVLSETNHVLGVMSDGQWMYKNDNN